MAQGIGLAGGYGAGGVRDALVDLIAQRRAQEEFEAVRAERAAMAQRQAMLDAQAAEDRQFTRARVAKGDERQARLDAEGREDKDAKQALEMATLFPGRVVSGEAKARAPKYLQDLLFKPKAEQLASRSIGGVSVAGDPNVGAIDIEEHAAIGPDSFELQMPESERKRIADERAAAMADKAERDAAFRERQQAERERHNETVEAIRASSAGHGSGAMRKITYTDDNGDIVEEYVTPDEARSRGPMKKPKPVKPVTGAERQTLAFYNRAKEASDTLAQGGLEGRIAKQNGMGQLWGQYAPNIAQTKDQQLYRQAQRAFTEARLRKESGAAIPDAEYEGDARIYFAQPGDAPETIAQKQKARQAVLDGLKFSAGKAYGEFYGESEGAPPGGGGGVELIFDPKTGRAVPKEP